MRPVIKARTRIIYLFIRMRNWFCVDYYMVTPCGLSPSSLVIFPASPIALNIYHNWSDKHKCHYMETVWVPSASASADPRQLAANQQQLLIVCKLINITAGLARNLRPRAGSWSWHHGTMAFWQVQYGRETTTPTPVPSPTATPGTASSKQLSSERRTERSGRVHGMEGCQDSVTAGWAIVEQQFLIKF